MNTQLPNKEEIDTLIQSLPLLYEDGFDPVKEWHGKEISMYPEYKKDVVKFMDMCHQNCWVDCDYDLKKPEIILKDMVLIKSASLEEIKALLTFCNRGERFCDGHIASMFENGVIKSIINRLKTISNELGNLTNSKLGACYSKIKKILNNDIETYEAIALIEKYRQYFKPDKVKVLLLAESHVFTTEQDVIISIPDIESLPGYPVNYAKFVYCLGYGERQLTSSSIHPKRDGTPQFWKIFYSCINNINSNEDFSPITSASKFEQRLKNKISLLLELKRQGIWLVDASIVALYNNGVKPNTLKMSSVIKTSWDYYTSNIVKECNPEHVIIIGKGVAKTIEADLQKIVGNNYSVIPQPNAHLSAEEHIRNFKMYFELCSKKL